jgi:hypothetical protein
LEIRQKEGYAPLVHAGALSNRTPWTVISGLYLCLT